VRIWVDADAAPRAVKEMLYRVADKHQLEVILVANQLLRTPPSRYIRCVTVGRDFDAADDWLVTQVQPGELVTTGDVPLAARVVDLGATALDPRGEILDESNVRSRLVMRNLLEQVRESGEQLGGPRPFSDRDKNRFAASLQRWLSQRKTS
jgi:uncharacterized protein YaiI (UPF0178 family)